MTWALIAVLVIATGFVSAGLGVPGPVIFLSLVYAGAVGLVVQICSAVRSS